MTEQRVTRPVMRYHGSKWRIAPWVISLMPEHDRYIEPFGGAAAVLLRKPRAQHEVYNDLWADIVSVFRLLRDPSQAEQLRQACALSPFSRQDLHECDEVTNDPIESARRMIFRSYAGFGSASANALHSTGFRGAHRKGHQGPAMDWRSWPDNVPAFVERLRGVVIENRPADQVIARYDSPHTLHYVDPPYVHQTRGMRRTNESYVHEMSDADHAMLAAALHSCDGFVMISGYRCDLYQELYGDWHREDRKTYADRGSPRTESIWMNFKPQGDPND